MKALDEGQLAYYGLANLLHMLASKKILTHDETMNILDWSSKGFEGLMEHYKKEKESENFRTVGDDMEILRPDYEEKEVNRHFKENEND